MDKKQEFGKRTLKLVRDTPKDNRENREVTATELEALCSKYSKELAPLVVRWCQMRDYPHARTREDRLIFDSLFTRINVALGELSKSGSSLGMVKLHVRREELEKVSIDALPQT